MVMVMVMVMVTITTMMTTITMTTRMMAMMMMTGGNAVQQICFVQSSPFGIFDGFGDRGARTLVLTKMDLREARVIENCE
eukprot:3287331-Pyramimonas_sp.AAC.1